MSIFHSPPAPLQAVLQLAEGVGVAAQESHRQLCGVLLRRMVQRTAINDVWLKLTTGAQDAVKAGVLNAIANEPQQYLRHNLAHLIGELAVTAAGDGCSDWPAVLETAQALSQNSEPKWREDSAVLFLRLSEYAGASVVEPHAAAIHGILAGLLADSELNVRLAALEATANFVNTLENDENKEPFVSLVGTMLSVLEQAAMNSSDEEALRRVLKGLIQLVTENAQVLRSDLEAACMAMVTIANAEELEIE
jgi:hypothetical protein